MAESATVIVIAILAFLTQKHAVLLIFVLLDKLTMRK